MQDQLNNNWELFIKCQNVIEEQERYINKLQQELNISKTKNKQIDRRSSEQQELVQALNAKVQGLSHQNECYRIQVQKREKEIGDMRQQLGSMCRRVQESEDSLNRIKKLYEAKLQKIKIQSLESKEKEKEKERHRQRQYEMGHRSRMNSMNTYTPMKYECKPYGKRLEQTCEKTLINSPYLSKRKHIQQVFKTQEDEEITVQASNKKNYSIKKTLRQLEERMQVMAIKLKQNPQMD